MSINHTDGSGTPGITGGGGGTMPVPPPVPPVPPPDPPPPPTGPPKIGTPPGPGRFGNPGPKAGVDEATSIAGTYGATKSPGKSPVPSCPITGIALSGPAAAPKTDATALSGAAFATGAAARRILPLSATPPIRIPGERATSSARAELAPAAIETPGVSSVVRNNAAAGIASVTAAITVPLPLSRVNNLFAFMSLHLSYFTTRNIEHLHLFRIVTKKSQIVKTIFQP